ncbi:hypothetical protein [Streptomyces sp. NPDC089799]|uniref:hypothetical protein n=1 Tax=Streptomyces sp. NPDC089799 TaxID=3155066 RepID=UPI0034375D59
MSMRLPRHLVLLALATTAALGSLSLASAEAATQPLASPTAHPARAVPRVYPNPDRDDGFVTHNVYVGHSQKYRVTCIDGQCGPPRHWQTYKSPRPRPFDGVAAAINGAAAQ